MILRYSQITPERSRYYAMQEPVVEAAYKCPDCGLLARFNISKTVTGRDDEDEYIQELVKRRDGVCLYLPPVEEWKSEAADIKKRLESLGYV